MHCGKRIGFSSTKKVRMTKGRTLPMCATRHRVWTLQRDDVTINHVPSNIKAVLCDSCNAAHHGCCKNKPAAGALRRALSHAR